MPKSPKVLLISGILTCFFDFLSTEIITVFVPVLLVLLIKKEENTIITKGDNNNSVDKPISEDEVLGKVVFIAKNVEVWKKVFADKRVFIPLTITMTLLAILIFYQEDRSKKCPKEEKQ